MFWYPWFDRVVLLAIIVNCILLMTDEPLCTGHGAGLCNEFDPIEKCAPCIDRTNGIYEGLERWVCNQPQAFYDEYPCPSFGVCHGWKSSRMSHQCDRIALVINGWAEHVFAILFSIEMVCKVICQGAFLHKGAYLRDGWNWIDFIVVCLTWLGYIPSMGNFSGLRTVRVLRPLRTMSKIPGMRPLIAAIFGSLKPLVDVMVLFVFVFIFFGIAGVQMLSGMFRGRCTYLDGPLVNTWSEDPQNQFRLCSLSPGGRECDAGWLPWDSQDPTHLWQTVKSWNNGQNQTVDGFWTTDCAVQLCGGDVSNCAEWSTIEPKNQMIATLALRKFCGNGTLAYSRLESFGWRLLLESDNRSVGLGALVPRRLLSKGFWSSRSKAICAQLAASSALGQVTDAPLYALAGMIGEVKCCERRASGDYSTDTSVYSVLEPMEPDDVNYEESYCTACRAYTDDPAVLNPNKEEYYGHIHFDHIGASFLTIFQCISMEGWTDIMCAPRAAPSRSPLLICVRAQVRHGGRIPALGFSLLLRPNHLGRLLVHDQPSACGDK